MNTQRLSFSSYSFVNTPSGAFFFFPALKDRKRKQAADERDPAAFVTIEVFEDERDISGLGVKAKSSLYVDLGSSQAEELRLRLIERGPSEVPIEFEFDLDTDDKLRRVLVDNQPLRPQETRPSDVRALADPKTPPYVKGSGKTGR